MERIYCKHETKYLRMRKRIHCNAIVALDAISPGPGEKLILTAWKKINFVISQTKISNYY